MPFVIFLLAIAAGVSNPMQSGLNAELNKQLGRPLWTGLFVYGTGFVVLLVLQGFFRGALPAGRIVTVPWWAWLGGLVSLISTMIALTFAQRLGSGLFTGATVTAALVTSVLVDHFGLIGFRQHAASPGRLAGCALMIGGLWMIARF